VLAKISKMKEPSTVRGTHSLTTHCGEGPSKSGDLHFAVGVSIDRNQKTPGKDPSPQLTWPHFMAKQVCTLETRTGGRQSFIRGRRP
jgi:hypothetical protein